MSDASKTDRDDSDEKFFFFLSVLAKCGGKLLVFNGELFSTCRSVAQLQCASVTSFCRGTRELSQRRARGPCIEPFLEPIVHEVPLARARFVFSVPVA